MSARRGPGRPSKLPEETLRLIVIARLRGDSFPKIAGSLNDRHVPTATGCEWTHAGVYQVFTSDRATKLMSERGAELHGPSE
jgi:hypothetical protein